MNYEEKQHCEPEEKSGTIRIELPSGAFDGIRKMMAGFMRPSESGPGCCEPSMNRRCPESKDEDRCEFTVTIGRKE